MGKMIRKFKYLHAVVFLSPLILLHSFLLLRLSFFPYPELFVYPYLAENGFLPYTQILDQHFPSLLMFPLNLYDFGLRSAFSGRIFLIGIVTLSHIFLYLVAKKLLKSEKKAVVANLLYFLLQPLFEGTTLWLDSFLVPILLIALYFSLKFIDDKRNLDLALSGLFLGLALFLKQVILPLVIAITIYFYFKNKNLSKIFLFLFFALLPLTLTIAWVYSKGIFNDFFYWTVTFNFDVYAKMGRKLPNLSQLARVLIFWTPAFYWVYSKFRREEIVLLGIFMFFSLATAVSRFEFVHLQPSLAFAVLLITVFLSKGKEKLKFLYILVMLSAIGVWSVRFYSQNWGGATYFFDEETIKVAQKVTELSEPNEKIFVLGAQPIIYYLADRLPAGKIFSVSVPWNMRVAQEIILNGLKEDKPKVVVRDDAASIDQVKVVDFTKSLNEYINEFYVKVGEVGPTEILVLR